ncbi:MAG: VCBS repeat-containing protein [Bdellovibrionales bacterium]|nr:VCBS repeat-containing protein [Bdellovibrionales bacterium]
MASLTAQRRLGQADERLGGIFERLSSGQRITRASDDAAGLAIADSLRADSRLYLTAVRNTNDGLSALSIADGALNELTGIVSKIIELSEQSANGTYSTEQRLALDTEAQSLAAEYSRIVDTTEFNGIKLLSSEGSSLDLQVDIRSTEDHRILAALPSAGQVTIGDGTFTAGLSLTSTNNNVTIATADLDGDGYADIVTRDGGQIAIFLGNGDGTFTASGQTRPVSSAPESVAIGDIDNNGTLDIVSAHQASNAIGVLFGNGDGTFTVGQSSLGTTQPYDITLGFFDNDDYLDVAVSKRFSNQDVDIYLNDGAGNFTYNNTVVTGRHQSAVVAGEFTGDNIEDIATLGTNGHFFLLEGNNDGTFNVSPDYVIGNTHAETEFDVGDMNNDGFLDVIIGHNNNTVGILLNNGDGTFATERTFASGGGIFDVQVGDFNGDGNLDVVSADYDDSAVSVLLGDGNGNLAAATTFAVAGDVENLALADFNDDGVLDIAAASFSAATVDILIANTTTRGGLAAFNLRTDDDARSALDSMKSTLAEIALNRGDIGAAQSRLSASLAKDLAGSENARAAEARIRDVDIAKESSALVRNQILQQVGSAVLAQANLLPNLAISLLT